MPIGIGSALAQHLIIVMAMRRHVVAVMVINPVIDMIGAIEPRLRTAIILDGRLPPVVSPPSCGAFRPDQATLSNNTRTVNDLNQLSSYFKLPPIVANARDILSTEQWDQEEETTMRLLTIAATLCITHGPALALLFVAAGITVAVARRQG